MAVPLGRVGVWAPQRLFDGLSNTELGEIAAELEQSGYGALWLGSATADLPIAEGILGGSTGLALATGIVNVWRDPADRTAAGYHRVNDAFPDRLLLGVGAGHREATQRYERPYDTLVAYLAALASAERPVPAANTALAALGPKVLALAAERTAGAHPYLVTPEYTRLAREVVGAGPLLAPEQKVVLETDPARARDIGRRSVAYYLRLSNYLANLRRLGFADDDFADGGSDRLVDALVAWGDADTVARRVAEHLAAGADHVAVQVLTAADDEPGPPRAELRALGAALFG